VGKHALLAVLILAMGAGRAPAEDRPNLSRVVVPDDSKEALKVLKEWLDARGLDVERHKDYLVMRKGGVLMNLTPLVYAHDLDRLRVTALFYPKDEFKKSNEMEQLAAKLNRSQNFMQVFVDNDGILVFGSNLTFYDELTARHFDAFVDAFAQIVKKYGLTEEALKMLK
jgi:hypothetical protein